MELMDDVIVAAGEESAFPEFIVIMADEVFAEDDARAESAETEHRQRRQHDDRRLVRRVMAMVVAMAMVVRMILMRLIAIRMG